jgi:hypothetical protein
MLLKFISIPYKSIIEKYNSSNQKNNAAVKNASKPGF